MEGRRTANKISSSNSTGFKNIASKLSNILQKPNPKDQPEGEEIICSKFALFDSRTFILLGYHHGFQIWEVGNSEIFECISIRSTISRVVAIELLCDPESIEDEYSSVRPLIMILESKMGSASEIGPQVKAHVYSLSTLEFLDIIEFKEEMESLKSSKSAIVIASSTAIQIHSPTDLSLLFSLTDIWRGLVFDLASRYICYATSTPLQKVNNSTDGLFRLDENYEQNDVDYIQKAQKKARKAAKAIAKAIAKKAANASYNVGEAGYHALHNYFAGGNTPNSIDRTIDIQDGVVIIRKLKSNSSDTQVVSHFKPHDHQVSNITFNASGTILLTASTNGTTIYAWSLMESQPTQLMKFSRGLTSAVITNLNLSFDDDWLVCTTSRGTFHIYEFETNSFVVINSRNSFEVVRSLLSNDPVQERTISPVNIRSSSMDNATSDLGYDDFFIDSGKNVFMGTNVSHPYDSMKSNEQRRSRAPFLLWNPFGIISLTIVEKEIAASSPLISSSISILNRGISEWNVCRSKDWDDFFLPISKTDSSTAAQLNWRSQIEIVTTEESSTFWENPTCGIHRFEHDKKGNIIGSKAIVVSTSKPVPHGHTSVLSNDTMLDGLQNAMDTDLVDGVPTIEVNEVDNKD